MTSQTTIPVGIYWKPGVWDLARSAYLADLDTDAESPGSFVGWLAQALELHARRSPQQRSELAAAGEKHPALVSVTRKNLNKEARPARLGHQRRRRPALVVDCGELGRIGGWGFVPGGSDSPRPKRPASGWGASCRRDR